MPTLVVSTVGTSLLTNALRRSAREHVEEVLKYANASEDTVPGEILARAEETVEQTAGGLRDADATAVRQASAELNGLVSFYEGTQKDERDQHWLIATDTALGRLTAQGVEQILRERGIQAVQTYVPRGLSAENTHALKEGVKRFLNWCERTVPDYRESGYEVVFNLTGGFKSLQGILNTVGMFYADRMVYIFQTGPELIRIPRLPVKLATEVFEKTPVRFLRLEALDRVPDGTLPEEQFEDVQDALLDAVEGRVYSFSEWGLLLWNQTRRDLLERKEPFDLPRLRYTDGFRKDVRTATPDQRRRLHETLAVVSVTLEVHDGNTAPLKRHGALQYENYTSTTTPDGQPIGHFRLYDDTEGRRVSCQAEDGALRLRRFGRHDEVNANP